MPSIRPASAARTRAAIEIAIVVALLAGSGVWATRFWSGWVARGGKPFFYQTYFEPAVMIACGKGFVISQGPQPKPLDDFLNQRRDAIDCRDLPADLKVSADRLYQRAWFHLEWTVGLAWRVLGISWSRMGPLFGLLFGATVALAYGIFRLGMGRALAALGAVGLTVSSTHLINLPHLRDYAKAPFTLALILLLGFAVTRTLSRRALLALAAGFGVVLGIGYGFRTDFLTALPLFPIVLFAFLPGGLSKRLMLKTAAVCVSITAFVFTSWPALTSVYDRGGCQWHVTLLGLQSPFDSPLHVAAAPYDFGYAYGDAYIDWTIQGYAHRMNPASPPLAFCSHEYDVQSGSYLRAIVSAFPADVIVRAYASVLQITELPFQGWMPPMPGWGDWFYKMRMDWLRPRVGWGLVLVVCAVALIGSASIRLGLFALFFVAYFGGYPAIQFHQRHHFHLEFVTWWAAGFVLQQLIVSAPALRHGLPDWRSLLPPAARAGALAVTGALVVLSLLGAARWYQHRVAVRLFKTYQSAEKTAVPFPNGELHDVAKADWPQFLEVDVNAAACGPRPAVTFRYDTPPGFGDLSRTFTVATGAPGVSRIFLPVFALFRRVEFSDERAGCLAGIYRFTDLQRYPLLLGAMLPPDWERLPLHQQLQDWRLEQ